MPHLIRTKYKFSSQIWLYEGPTAWHFVTVPKEQSDRIKSNITGVRRGWGAVRVSVSIGEVQWKTSIFPESKTGFYILPLKAEVRKKANIAVGDIVNVVIAIG